MQSKLSNERLKKLGLFVKDLIRRIKDDNVTAIGAQLSYYLILSVFPFLMFFLNILSFTSLANQDLWQNVIIVLPAQTQDLITKLITETINSSNQTFLSFSAITGLWAASKGIMALINAINTAYDIEESRNFIVLRLLAIIFTLGLLALLIIVLSTLVFGEVIAKSLLTELGLGEKSVVLWHYMRILISLVSMVIIFALFYKLSPSIKNHSRIKFKHSLPGAVFSTLGWVITSSLFSFYINNFGNYAKTYGSIGGVIVLLLWLYMSSIIIVIGGEINASLTHVKEVL